MICDTDYKRPDENNLIQKGDNNPKIKKVQNDALRRFE